MLNKFRLKLGNHSADNISDLQKYCRCKEIVDYFKDGRLIEWLEHRNERHIIDGLQKISKKITYPTLENEICEVICSAKVTSEDPVFTINYNPYIPKIKISLNIEPAYSHVEKRRLQVDVEDVVKKLSEKCYSKKFKVIFYGRLLDFDDFENICEELKAQKYEIKLEHKRRFEIENARRNLDLLLNHIETNSKGHFSEIEIKKVQKSIKKAMGAEFEIAVVATVSAGKSTLINAILQQDILPARNEATTAKIFRIKNIDGQKDFYAHCKYKNGKSIPCKLEELDKQNNNQDIHTIEITGNIPNIKFDILDLVILDTPGPNNSQDIEHKNKTYQVINDDDNRPIILYILNAQQLSTNDDANLLSAIATSMEKSHKNMEKRDRFIFVLNKVDSLESEKGESVKKYMDKCKEYLKQFGIDKPLIFPVSAEFARVIRKNIAKIDLTRNEKKLFSDVEDVNKLEELHLEQYAPIDKQSMKRINNEVERQKKLAEEWKEHIEERDNAQKQEALIHSGIVSLEYAIDDYVRKYASAIKIGDALEELQKIVDINKALEDIKKQIYQSDEKKELVRLEQVRLKSKISDLIQNKSKLEQKIQSVVIDNGDIKRIEKDFNLAHLEAIRILNGEKPIKEAETLLEIASRRISEAAVRAKNELERLYRHTISDQIDSLIKEFRDFIEHNFKDLGMYQDLVNVEIPSSKVIAAYVADKVDGGYYKTIDEGNTFIAILSLGFCGREQKEWVDIKKKVVDLSKLRNERFAGISRQFEDSLKEYKKYLENETVRVRKEVGRALENFTSTINEHVRKIDELIQKDKQIGKDKEQNEEKQKFYKELKEKLDNIYGDENEK